MIDELGPLKITEIKNAIVAWMKANSKASILHIQYLRSDTYFYFVHIWYK